MIASSILLLILLDTFVLAALYHMNYICVVYFFIMKLPNSYLCKILRNEETM